MTVAVFVTMMRMAMMFVPMLAATIAMRVLMVVRMCMSVRMFMRVLMPMSGVPRQRA